MSSFRLALNDPTFALNSLLRQDPKPDPQLLQEVSHLGCKDAIAKGLSFPYRFGRGLRDRHDL